MGKDVDVRMEEEVASSHPRVRCFGVVGNHVVGDGDAKVVEIV